MCTQILSPLLKYVPSHLKDTHTHLEQLSSLTQEQLKGLKFCTADVTSLYTNINIFGCVEDVIALAAEHIDDLELYELNLTDVHEMLELVFSNSFFVFDGKIYQQMIGLFMGCKPSPIGAIVRVYTFESRSVYTEVFTQILTIPVMYGRYVDDAGTVTSDEERANQPRSLAHRSE